MDKYIYGMVSLLEQLILLWAGTVTPQMLGKDVPSGISAGVSPTHLLPIVFESLTFFHGL